MSLWPFKIAAYNIIAWSNRSFSTHLIKQSMMIELSWNFGITYFMMVFFAAPTSIVNWRGQLPYKYGTITWALQISMKKHETYVFTKHLLAKLNHCWTSGMAPPVLWCQARVKGNGFSINRFILGFYYLIVSIITFVEEQSNSFVGALVPNFQWLKISGLFRMKIM